MNLSRVIVSLGLALTSPVALGQGAKPNVDDIVKSVQARKFPDNSFSDMAMTIKKGDSSVEKAFKIWSLRISPEESHSLIEFAKPGNTKILAYSRKGGDDDRWIKTSTGQPKRISNSAENSSFAQSHFSYADLEFAKSGNFTNELMCVADKCEVDYKGAPHYKLKSVPKKADSDYAYLINYIRVADSYGDRSEYYSKDGKLIKELTVDEIKDIAGFPVPMVITMKMADTGDFTTIKATKVDINTKDITKQMFDKNLL